MLADMSIAETTQYLTFTLDEAVFALDISRVREVLDLVAMTKVPRAPAYMIGVINLRGRVVPVFDLRIKFGMSPTTRTLNTCVIIIEVIVDNERTVLGTLADSVKEVIDLETEVIEPAPRMGTRLRNDIIKGMGKHRDGFIILLDIDRVFSADEISVVEDGVGVQSLTHEWG
jgi:purine-binding chemotaxis protein CheW